MTITVKLYGDLREKVKTQDIRNNSPFSIEIEFRMTNLEFGTILSKMNVSNTIGYYLFTDLNGKIYFHMISGNYYHKVNTTDSGFNDDTWKKLIITYDGAFTSKIYVDNNTPKNLTVSNTGTFLDDITNTKNLTLSGVMKGLREMTYIMKAAFLLFFMLTII